MFYGIDIGGSKIELVVFDHLFMPLWRKRIATPLSSYSEFIDSLIDLILQADLQCSVRGQVGISMPGLINQNTGTIYATNITLLQDKAFVEELEKAIFRPVVIDNDANCFVLSEAYDDDFKSYATILGLILGTGVGGGIVVNNKVLSGANGCAGEIGHIRLPIDASYILGSDNSLLKCGCGLLGCSEQYLSGKGFEWLYAHYNHHRLKAQTIVERYYQGDELAKAHVDRYLELLAAYLANLMMIIDADVIVIGGGLSNFDAIYQHVPERMTKYLLQHMKAPKIIKARHGDAGGARGAALLCLDKKK